MNQYLLSPDGLFTMTQDEFIKIAPLVTEDYFRGQKLGFTEYSNANHIFAALVLEEVTGQQLCEVMRQEVFMPLQMTNTAISGEALEKLKTNGCDIATGHRVYGDMTTVRPLAHNTSMSDTIEVATFGAYSCTHDIAKLLRELLKAADNASDLFTATDAQYLFGPKSDYGDGAKVTLVGMLCKVDSHVPGVESTNRVLSSDHQDYTYRLGTLARKRSCDVYYKAGTIDGFSCSIYVVLKFRSFVIALANSSGPLDVADHMTRYCLQDALSLTPRVDIVSKVLGERSWTSSKVREYEHDDLSSPSQHTVPSDFVGCFVHTKYGQVMRVWQNGEVQFGQEKLSSLMRSRYSGNTLRVIPGPTGFGIDRWSVWSRLEYDLSSREGKLGLVMRGTTDEYEKVKEKDESPGKSPHQR